MLHPFSQIGLTMNSMITVHLSTYKRLLGLKGYLNITINTIYPSILPIR